MMRHIIDILEEAIPDCNLDNANGFCILKPGFSEYTDEFIGLLGANGWKVLKKINKKLSKNEAQELYKMHSNKSFYDKLCNYMSSDNCLCIACKKKTKDPIGDMDKFKDKFRNMYGKNDMENGMHSSDSIDNLHREIKLIFDDCKHIKESSQISQNNIDNVQSEIDDTEPNKTNQLKTIDADTIKSVILNTDSLGKLITIVKDNGKNFNAKFNKNDFAKDGLISKNIVNICKYFKEVYGAPNVKIDIKTYSINIEK